LPQPNPLEQPLASTTQRPANPRPSTSPPQAGSSPLVAHVSRLNFIMPDNSGTRKVPIQAMLRGPGPAQYSLPSNTGSLNLDCRKAYPPSYSMGASLPIGEKLRSPGPGKYGIPSGMLRSGQYPGSEYTMRIKPNPLKTNMTPGPAKYTMPSPTSTNEMKAAEYTMRPKLPTKGRSITPAPNVYQLPTLVGSKVSHSSPNRLQTAEQWSMTGRSDVGSFTQILNVTPGPGIYRPEDTINNVQNRQPSYTMRPRNWAPGSKTRTPGPKYNIRRNAATPGGTFGSKHSQYTYVVCE